MSNRAVLYLRHSPKPKDKMTLDSLEVQRERGLTYAKLMGYEVVKEFEYPFVSARKVAFANRGGAEIVKFCRENNVQHIIVQRVDRVFRDFADASASIAKLNKLGLRLHVTDQGGIWGDFSTPQGWLVCAISILFAEYESRMISDRTRRTALNAQDRMLTTSAQAPLGFRLADEPRVEGHKKTRTGPDGRQIESGGYARIEICPEEARSVLRLFQLHSDSLSSAKIAGILNDEGYVTRFKTPWIPRRVSKVIARMKNGRWLRLLREWESKQPRPGELVG